MLALALALPAFAVDAVNPEYEADRYRSHRDVSTVGLVVGTVGLLSGAAGVALLPDDDMPARLLGVQGVIGLAGGAVVTSVAGLQARRYPLDRAPSLVPAAFSLGLASVAAVGLTSYAFTGDPATQDAILLGSLGAAGGSLLFGAIQLGVNGKAWQARSDAQWLDAEVTFVPVPVPSGGGAALVGRF